MTLERAAETFELPKFDVQTISCADLPRPVAEFFQARSEMFLQPEDVKGIDGFSLLAVVTSGQDDVTRYVGQEGKTYTGTDGAEETLVHMIEFTKTDRQLGHGEIRLGHSEDEFFKDKPFVGFTRTEEDFQCRGYGRKRLFVMNHLTHMLFGLPLHSSTLIAPPAESLWKRLAKEDLVETYREGAHVRYCFRSRT